MAFRVGDAVRLKPASRLRGRSEAWADAVGRVCIVYDQLDDDDGLRIAVAFPSGGCSPPLSSDDFELHAARPGEGA